LDISREYGSRAATAAANVARQAIEQAGWSRATLRDDRTAIVLGTSKGEIEDWISPPPTLTSDNQPPAGRRTEFGLSGLTQRVATALDVAHGPRTTLSAACASGLHALIRACVMLQVGEADRAIVLATEASVHPLFISSFERLGVLPPAGHGCRPFDVTRAGFLMTEAAAAVCLERSPSTGRAIVGIERFALAGDASHLTASDASGAPLRHILSQVIGNRPVDLVHAHGTGTVVNDPIELAAIDATLGARRNAPATIYSHKAHLGHALGAAGMVSVVLNCLGHQRGLVPGNANTSAPLTARHCEVAQAPVRRTVHRSICLAAGFGGPMGAVSLVTADT
jgi:3-oxoacyl-[acyl-carrier-protein] synthase II